MTKKLYHLVYGRLYVDLSETYDPYFYSYSTIFRNIPSNLVATIVSFQDKIKEYCDKNYKENATNFRNKTVLKILPSKEYYKTYKDIFDEDIMKGETNHLYTDYGQLYNKRQFFKYDFNPKITEQYSYKGLNSSSLLDQNGAGKLPRKDI